MSLVGIFPIENWNFNSHSILTELDTADLETLFENSIERIYKGGETIFREGDPPLGIYYIRQGAIKKYKVDNFHKEHIIYVASAGELIGYHGILASEQQPDSATTLEESTIAFIPQKNLFAVLSRSTKLSMNFLKTLSHEFTVLTNNLSVFARRPVRERIAINLLLLREKFKKENPRQEQILINVSREDIASMSGTSRESTVRILRHFKNEQIIQTKGRKIWVTDLKKLVNATNYSYNT